MKSEWETIKEYKGVQLKQSKNGLLRFFYKKYFVCIELEIDNENIVTIKVNCNYMEDSSIDFLIKELEVSKEYKNYFQKYICENIKK